MSTKPIYSVERVYPVTMDRLWSAWTKAAELEQWYHPTVLTCVPGSATSDAEVDGIWSIAVDVPEYGFVAYFWGRYLTVEKHKQLEHTMIYSQDEAEFVFKDQNKLAHRVVVDFEERDGGSWVRFSHFGELPEEQIEATQAGMESYFDSLAEHLS